MENKESQLKTVEINDKLKIFINFFGITLICISTFILFFNIPDLDKQIQKYETDFYVANSFYNNALIKSASLSSREGTIYLLINSLNLSDFKVDVFYDTSQNASLLSLERGGKIEYYGGETPSYTILLKNLINYREGLRDVAIAFCSAAGNCSENTFNEISNIMIISNLKEKISSLFEDTVRNFNRINREKSSLETIKSNYVLYGLLVQILGIILSSEAIVYLIKIFLSKSKS
jgi:hypothetical protein